MESVLLDVGGHRRSPAKPQYDGDKCAGQHRARECE
jgi:hypothetical protein